MWFTKYTRPTLASKAIKNGTFKMGALGPLAIERKKPYALIEQLLKDAEKYDNGKMQNEAIRDALLNEVINIIEKIIDL